MRASTDSARSTEIRPDTVTIETLPTLPRTSTRADVVPITRSVPFGTRTTMPLPTRSIVVCAP